MNLKKLAGKFPNDDSLITSMAKLDHFYGYYNGGRFTLPWCTPRSWLPIFFSAGGQRGQENYEHIHVICLEAKCTS